MEPLVVVVVYACVQKNRLQKKSEALERKTRLEIIIHSVALSEGAGNSEFTFGSDAEDLFLFILILHS